MKYLFNTKKLKLLLSFRKNQPSKKDCDNDESQLQPSPSRSNTISALPIKELLDLASQNNHSFFHHFLKTFPDFDRKLLEISPSIKISDIEFCAFIKLNLDTKQIATIKKMTVGAVEAKKYRIRKKLKISSDENIYIRISRF